MFFLTILTIILLLVWVSWLGGQVLQLTGRLSVAEAQTKVLLDRSAETAATVLQLAQATTAAVTHLQTELVKIRNPPAEGTTGESR